MFQLKNKAFLVKVVDVPEEGKALPSPAQLESAKEGAMDAAYELGTGVVAGAAALIMIYMGSDTIRQIAIHTAKSLIK